MKDDPLFQSAALAVWLVASTTGVTVQAQTAGEYLAGARQSGGLVDALAREKQARAAVPEASKKLEELERTLGSNDPRTAAALHELGKLYMTVGDYQRAQRTFERALQIRTDTVGRESPQTAATLSELAEFQAQIGDFARAEAMQRDALAIREKLGAQNLDTAESLHRLGNILRRLEKRDEAEPMLKRALAIREKQLKPADVEIGYVLKALAELESARGNRDAGAKYGARAREIIVKELGSNSAEAQDLRAVPQTIADGWLRGIDSIATGTDARKLPIERAALYGPFNLPTARHLSGDADLLHREGGAEKLEQAQRLADRAALIRQKLLGPDHADTIRSVEQLALIALDMKQPDRARQHARTAMFAQLAHLRGIFDFADEQQRLAFRDTLRPWSLFASLPEVPVNDLAEAIVRFKGIVLDSLLEDRRAERIKLDPALSAKLDELRLARATLTELERRAADATDETPGNSAPEREEKRRAIRTFEVALLQAGVGGGGRALDVTIEQIRAGLPAGAALIEMVRYPHYLGSDQWENRYGGFVLTVRDAPRWIAFGAAAEIDEEVERYRKSMNMETDVPTTVEVLRQLEIRLWEPVAALLPRDTTTVVLSPDGPLNFVSFATLLAADGKFLSEKYLVMYAASGRDLAIDLPQRSAQGAEIVFFARPQFGEPLRGARKFEDLPGTDDEAAALEKLARAAGWKPTIYRDAEANEAALAMLSSPRALHLATHGFLLDEKEMPPEKTPGRVNPMRRSGVALSGARNTLAAWRRGETPSRKTDGMVTADEIGALDLRRTWLVALSACETGSGEARAGEGVLGLRRGFIEAGAQNVLMTLWPIPDDMTVKIMADFYARAFATGDAARALAETQRDWLAKLRAEKPADLRHAVQNAGPFILSVQGHLPERPATKR